MDTKLVIEVLQVVAGFAGMLTALFHLRRARIENARRAAAPEPVVLASPAPGAPAIVVPRVEAALIGLRADRYWERFRAFEARGTTRFSATFHWTAFLLGGFWFLYRKLYGWGVVFLAAEATALAMVRVYSRTSIASISAGAMLVSMITAGTIANYVYFRTVLRRARELRERAGGDEARAVALAREVGGVSTGVLVVAVIAFALVIAATVVLSDDVLYNRSRRFIRRSLRAIRRAI